MIGSLPLGSTKLCQMSDSFKPPVEGELLLTRRFNVKFYFSLPLYILIPLSFAVFVLMVFQWCGVDDPQEFLGNFFYAMLFVLIFTVPFRLLDFKWRKYMEKHPRRIYFSSKGLSKAMGKEFIRSESDKFILNSGIISFGDATYKPNRKFRGNQEKLIDFLNER